MTRFGVALFIFLASLSSKAEVACKVTDLRTSGSIFEGQLGIYPDNPETSKGIIFFPDGRTKTFEELDQIEAGSMDWAAAFFEGAGFLVATDDPADPEFIVISGNLRFRQGKNGKYRVIQYDTLESTQGKVLNFYNPELTKRFHCERK